MAKAKAVDILNNIAQQVKQEEKELEESGATLTHPAFTLSKLNGEWVVSKHMVNPAKGEKLHSGNQKSEAIERFKVAVGKSGILD